MASRRQFLSAIGVAGVSTVAGCNDSLLNPESDESNIEFRPQTDTDVVRVSGDNTVFSKIQPGFYHYTPSLRLSFTDDAHTVASRYKVLNTVEDDIIRVAEVKESVSSVTFPVELFDGTQVIAFNEQGDVVVAYKLLEEGL